MFEIFSKHYPKIGEILNQLRAGTVVGDQWSRERLSKLYGEMTKTVSDEIRAAIDLGLVRDVDPELLAFFNVLLDEIAVHRASIDDRYTARQVMSFVADMLYHAFLTEKGKQIFSAFNRSILKTTSWNLYLLYRTRYIPDNIFHSPKAPAR